MIGPVKQTAKFLHACVLRLVTRHHFHQHFQQKLLIVTYHRVCPVNSDSLGLVVPPAIFEAQVQFLRKHFNVLSFTDAMDSGRFDRGSEAAVVITFDDGWLDNFTHAYPILMRHRIPATIFLAVEAIEHGTFGWYRMDEAIRSAEDGVLDLREWKLGTIGIRTQREKDQAIRHLHTALKTMDHEIRLRVSDFIIDHYGRSRVGRHMLSWDEVREMHRGGLISIGSHTLSHPILTRISKDDVARELVVSKERIESALGAECQFFAYPNGTAADFDHDIMMMVRRAGYRAGCTMIPGHNHPQTDPFALRRIGVDRYASSGPLGGFSASMFESSILRPRSSKEAARAMNPGGM